MKTVEEIANVIVVRNHLALLLNGTRNVVKKQDIQLLSAMINKLDTDIIQASMEILSPTTKVPEDEDVAKKVAEAKANLSKTASTSKTKKTIKRTDSETPDSND